MHQEDFGLMPSHKIHSARHVLAANLRAFRTEMGLSQEQLAERAGIHRNYLGGIERCERNVGLDNLERLASALGVNLSVLLSDRWDRSFLGDRSE